MRFFVSFDVFDTCLIRRCGRPEKIWDLMAERLFHKDDSHNRMSFVGNRTIVEKNLCIQGKLYSTLDDLYEEMNVGQWGFSKQELMRLEMDVEEQELFPNPEILSLIKEFRLKGCTIAFISDMYLPSQFIRRVLSKFGFFIENDLIFVSAECKAAKYDGALFDYVFNQTGTNAEQWIHYGDNKVSDYSVPKSKGVEANWVSNTDFSDEEKRWLKDSCFYAHKRDIELWTGMCRLARIQNGCSNETNLAVDFIASCYVPYVQWIFETAKKNSIKRLFFLGRDGHIFYEIANQLKKENCGIELSYLKISRKAIYSCMFFDGSEYELKSTIGLSDGRTAEELINQIGLDFNDLSEETRKKYTATTRLLRKSNLTDFMESLKINDVDILKRNSFECRRCLLGYLTQEGVFTDETIAFVDLGWAGSCRCNLNYILKKSGFFSVKTFYWGVCNAVMRGDECDEFFSFLRSGIKDEMIDIVPLFMEHYASMNPDGTVIGYDCVDDVFIPREKEFDSSKELLSQINELSVKKVAELCYRDVFSSEAYYEVSLCCGLKQLERIVENPSEKEISVFSSVVVENYGENRYAVAKYGIKDLVAFLIWGWPTKQSFWNIASLKKSTGKYYPLFSKAIQYTPKTIMARVFKFFWDWKNR